MYKKPAITYTYKSIFFLWQSNCDLKLMGGIHEHLLHFNPHFNVTYKQVGIHRHNFDCLSKGLYLNVCASYHDPCQNFNGTF